MLTNKTLNELNAIQREIDRAVAYLMQDDVVGVAHKTDRPLGNHYTLRNPACLESGCAECEHIIAMNKHYGSHITGLYEAKKKLDWMVKREQEKKMGKTEDGTIA